MATATKPQVALKGARLKALYNKSLAPELQKELKLTNPHQVPKLQKIVINVGLGRAKDDKKLMEIATNTVKKITGQQPTRRQQSWTKSHSA
jgi:large subunit ribosomal protein L5